MALPTNDQHVTYQLQFRKCGKASCSTCRNGQGHGPYWYAYWREGTRLRSGYVGKVNPYLPTEQAQEKDGTVTNTVRGMGMTASSEKTRTGEAEVVPVSAKSFAASSLGA